MELNTVSSPLALVKRSLNFSSKATTPPSTSRKRKTISATPTAKRHFAVYENTPCSSFVDSGVCTSYDMSDRDINITDFDDSLNVLSHSYVAFKPQQFTVSSPLKTPDSSEYLTSSLEKCSLYDFENSEHNAKRVKWDPDLTRKSNSAPGTPQRVTPETDVSLKKFISLEFTPTKTWQCIGTPEKNQILYPQLMEVKPFNFRPQKPKNEVKKCNLSKKRLFVCRDVLYLFTKKYNHTNIVSKIFSYLDDRDLQNVANVSTLWRNVLFNDPVASLRYKNRVKDIAVCKENIHPDKLMTYSPAFSRILIDKSNLSELTKPPSPPGSPEQENWRKFIKVAAYLSKSQTLAKCLKCNNPAIVEKNIGQCTKGWCCTIWCTRCWSNSTTGPENFVCRCPYSPQTSPNNTDRSGLSDISNLDDTVCHLYVEPESSSSGYFSTAGQEKAVVPPRTDLKKPKNSTALTDYNRNMPLPRSLPKKVPPQVTNIEDFHTVVSQCRKQKINNTPIIEPSSPPQVKLPAAGTRKSKKSLRRLFF